MDMMLEETDPKKRSELVQALTGRFRSIGRPLPPEELSAPAWWHGDEEAFELSQLASMQMPRRRR